MGLFGNLECLNVGVRGVGFERSGKGLSIGRV